MRTKFDIGAGSECPHCKTGEMIYRKSKFGDFLGCSRFPSCAFLQKIEEPEDEDEEIEYNCYEKNECDLVFN